MATVNEILDSVRELPALPSSAARVISALMKGEESLGEVEQIIKCDEAIAMTVLRYANSAQYGRPGRVFSLKDSILRLGHRALIKIALQQQVSSVLGAAGAAYGLRRGAMWRGALGGALAAEEIATEASYEDPELCFVCALLRDIGKLILDVHSRPEEIAVAGESVDADQSFLDAERAVFGADHAQIGAELATRWHLPVRIAEAILYHHDPPANEPVHDLLYDIVHASDVICLWTGLATGHDGLQYPLAPHVRDELIGKREHAELYMTAMWSRLNEIESEMNSPSIQGKSA